MMCLIVSSLSSACFQVLFGTVVAFSMLLLLLNYLGLRSGSWSLRHVLLLPAELPANITVQISSIKTHSTIKQARGAINSTTLSPSEFTPKNQVSCTWSPIERKSCKVLLKGRLPLVNVSRQ
mmetsp:Transcript_31700/g.80661  ORF Transcript_31700/g.80661 Transcript_31700/m.80661 type:complete len:122 (+) Transcript_31700:676-1041(+)